MGGVSDQLQIRFLDVGLKGTAATKEYAMKEAAKLQAKTAESKVMEQPKPFTPGITKAMVRQHAFELYRDKLKAGGSLTLQDWVLAEKDLDKMRDTGELAER